MKTKKLLLAAAALMVLTACGSEDSPVEPTEEPVEPTEAPVEPTEAPVEPTVAPTSAPTPKPPVTGAISLAGLGIAAIAAGAGIVIFRKKED